jgi:ABC-type transport system involved in multi-copper enzyme maturation permease subunit
MLRTLIAREFLNNILNLRFLIGLVLCLIVTVACIMILAHDYRQQMNDYNARMNIQDETLDSYAVAKPFLLIQMFHPQKPPERFRPLIIGISGNEGSGFFDYDPLPILFPPLDFLFIVTIVMSLLAMLFSYDAITGERQTGTLRLVISNSLSRAQVLFGKCLGGSASLLIPFLLALLLGVLYVSMNPSVQWDSSAWAELASLTAASVVFITLFYLLGLTISTFSRYSSTAILNCLFLWVLLILVIPNVSPYISAQLYRIPSIKGIERRQEEIKKHSIQVAAEHIKESAKKLRDKYDDLFSEFESMKYGCIGSFYIYGRDFDPKYQKAAQKRADVDPEFKVMMDAFREAVEKAMQESFRIQNELGDKLQEDLHGKAALQTKLAKSLACISPFTNYVYIARDVTGTGLRSLEYFEQTKGEYEQKAYAYVDKKASEARKENPALEEDSFLDVSDRPRFIFKEEPWKDKLGAVLPYWGILGLFNLVFFAAAFAGFVRYDVR